MADNSLIDGVTVLHGDDEYAIDQVLAVWYNSLGDPSMADLNTTRLDGRTLHENELRTATQSMPFLAEHRLVIVTDPLARLTGEANRNRFIEQLSHLAPTTALVLVVTDQVYKKDWETLRSGHWLRKWVDAHSDTSRLREYRLPQGRDMIGWVLQAVKAQRGQFTPQAAAELVDHLGSNTRQASQEIEKLLTYVNYQRPVDRDDVILLVAQEGEVDVFTMVDAMGSHNAKVAISLVQKILEKQDSLSVLALVTRHFRLLLMVREIIEEGGGPLVVTEQLGRTPFNISSKFYAEKLWGQARQFSMLRLENAFRQLVSIDEALKTSQMDGLTALTTFIAEITKAESRE